MMSTTAESIEAVAAELGLTMSAEFVPWSLSRNAGEKHPSLNWKVTLSKGGRTLLTTDYMAGSGHCPGYGSRDKYSERLIVAAECETGKVCHYAASGDRAVPGGKDIKPKFADVLHSLCSDSDVIDSPGFEEWAADTGMDTDSRKAEAVYRACLGIALKLRNALGEDGFAKLREACRDY